MASGKNPDERFYGRRKGHKLSPRKERLLADVLPKVAVSLEGAAPATLDPAKLFEKPVSGVWLEVGFGKGEHLALQAAANPGVGFIGCEPYVNGVAGLVTKIHEQKLANIRIYPDDARALLAALKDRSLDRVFLLHPDPWPKKRHAKRRFVSPANLDALARVMKPGAELRIGTDHATYMAWTMIQMQKRRDFRWLAERAADWRTPPRDWPETRYAAKAKADKTPCAYFRFERSSR